MKASPTRMIRRRKRAPGDQPFFKKETQEPGFFAETPQQTFFKPATNSIQRKCTDCEKEDKVQRRPDKKEEEKKEEDKKLQRQPDKKEEEKKMQKKEEDKNLHKKDTGSSPSAVNTPAYMNSLAGKGSILPESTQQFFGERMGYDFSEVRVHTDHEAGESAKEVNAKAYAIDHHIVFNEGQYNPESYEGKKLLAHELTHVVQQDNRSTIARKGEEGGQEAECAAGSVDLEALTSGVYRNGKGVVAKEKTEKTKGCPDCEDECVSITGTFKVPYNVTTSIAMPVVPGNLTPCQQKRVKAGIDGPLLTHEKKHVKALETFNGTASLPVDYKGCESQYTTYLENMKAQEFQRRQSIADAKSAALDPFTIPIDLCCKDKEVTKK